jgi:hypothetical protein
VGRKNDKVIKVMAKYRQILLEQTKLKWNIKKNIEK